MIVERCTPERLEDWVRMRKALWPDETLEQHHRYATSLLGRPMTPSSISPAKRVTIALLSPKRRCAGTMSTVVAVPQLAFSKESMSTQHIVNVGSRASFAKRSKNGQGVWAAANLHQMSC